MKQKKVRRILFSKFLILITIFTLFNFHNSNTYATTLTSATFECSTTNGGSTSVQNGYFYGGLSYGSLLRTRVKYDLSSLGSGTVTSATLNISVNDITNDTANPTIEVAGSTQDDFSSYTTSLLPIGSSLDSQLISSTGNYSFDVTSFVNQELQNDQVVTFVLKGTSDIESNSANGSYDSSAGFNTVSFSLDVTVVSVSSDATLSNLVSSSGSLSPSFDSNTTSYTLNLPYSTTSVNFTPTANDSNYSALTVDGNSTTSGNASSNKSLSVGNNNIDIVVTAEDGSTQKTYSVNAIRAAASTDATLSNLVPSSGSLSPSFDSNTTSYTVNVPYSTTSINLTPTANDSAHSSLTVNGNNTTSGSASSNVSLSVGNNNINTVVVAEDGSTQKTYTVNVIRAAASTDATLSNLVPSSGSLSPVFDSNTTTYTVNVANNVTTINFTATTNDSNHTSLTVDGNNTTSGSASSNISLSTGNNNVSIVVVAEDGTTSKTYTVNVVRAFSTDATLSNLVPSSGSLSPSFDSSTTSYTVNVPYSTTSINLTPTANDSAHSSLTVNGNNTTSGSASSNVSLSVGNNNINTVVVAEDGSTQKTYTVNVIRAAASTDATLSNLVPSSGSLSPVFDSNTTTYTVNVANNVTTINFTATTNDSNHTSLTVDGNNTTSGSASSNISLSTGNNNVSIVVVAEDGTTSKTYTVNVVRAFSTDATLSNLVPSSGSLSPSFDSSTTSYTVNVPYSTTSINLTPTANDSAHSSLTVDGNNTTSGSASSNVSLSVGNNNISTVVVAEDGSTQKTYTVNVIRATASTDATLSNLVPSSGSLSPVFDSNTTTYTLNVANNVTTINFTATTNDSNHTSLTVDGNNTTSGSASSNISLSTGNNNVSIVVVAEDGTTSKTYTVNVVRAFSTDATLSNLVPSSGSLSPSFDSSTTSYTVNVPYSTTSINLTPTANDSAHSSLTVDGNNTTSGSASSNVSLSVGNNNISTVVVAEDGSTQKTYTVNVIRATASTDATLSNLVPSSGSLSPVFDSNTTTYTLNVANNVTTINFTATTNDSNHTSLTVDGNNTTSGSASSNISLSTGNNNVSIVVVAEDGTTSKTYTVNVVRAFSTDATLSNLVPSSGSLSPSFDSNTTTYMLNVANNVSSINFTPTANDSAYSALTVDSNNTTSGSASSAISLSVGSNNVDIIVTAEDGTTSKTYSVDVVRAALSSDATLSNLVPNAGSSSPGFDSNTTSYMIMLPYSNDSINFTPTANNANYTSITVDSNNTTSGTASSNINLSQGINNIDVVVTAEDGTTQKTYSIEVIREYDLSLSNLVISEGNLTPTFDKDTTTYDVSVPYTTTTLTLTPSSNHPSSYTKINDMSCDYDQACDPIDLDVGSNTITVVIYENLISFNHSNTKFASISSSRGLDRYLTNNKFNKDLITNKIYNSLAIAQNSKTYTINVTREQASSDATLSNLVPSTSSLSPTFSSNQTNYNMSVSNSISTIKFTPTANDSNHKSIKVNSTEVTSGISSDNINLSVGSNTVTIVVTAQDDTTKTYTITINRQSPPTPDPDPKPDDGEEIEVDVVVDDEDDETDNQTAAKVVIKRTEEDGKIKDNIEFDEDKAEETVQKALETENNKAIIQVKDVQGKEANESDFTLKKESVEKLSENNIDLTITSDNAQLDIPKDTLKNIKTEDGNEDVSINIRKIDDPEEEKQVDEMIVSIVSGSKKIGVSVGISTNYSSLTKIFVPLKNVDIPTTKEEIDEFVSPLAVFIEHSDGENKIDKGEVAYDKDGNPIGINVWVSKFSNFSIIGLPVDGDPDPLFSGQKNSFETNFIEDKSFEIEFNKPIKEESFNTDNIYIYDYFRNKMPITIDMIKDDKIKITPETYFEKDKTYYLYLSDNLLAKDDSKLLENTRYKFNISSYELSGIKLKEYEDISLDKEWTISFNKEINKELIENCDIELFDEEENYKEFDIELNDDYSIKIIPKTNYKPGETYYLMINSAKLNDEVNIDDRTWIKFKTVDPSRTSKSIDDANYIIR
ncbi:cadherin-like beta sandwich domain-containing protein [Peptostreptococcaceae bacterium AGR-M142]